MKYIVYNTKTKSIYKVLDSPYMVDGKKGILPDYLVEVESEGEPVSGRVDLVTKQWRYSWWLRLLRAVYKGYLFLRDRIYQRK